MTANLELDETLEKLTEQQRVDFFKEYQRLVQQHNLSERRIMRILKLKEHELKVLCLLSECNLSLETSATKAIPLT